MQAKDSLRPAASVRETLLTSDMGVSPLDETASARQLQFSALSGLETSQPRPVMAGLTESEARRGMILQQIASIYRGLAFIYRQIAFFHRQIAFIHQPISIHPHLRHRAFPRSP